MMEYAPIRGVGTLARRRQNSWSVDQDEFNRQERKDR
jgi:hypothetical protein